MLSSGSRAIGWLSPGRGLSVETASVQPPYYWPRGRVAAPHLIIASTVVCVALSGAYTLFGVGRPGWGWLFNDLIFDATYFLGAASCLLRSLYRGPDMWAWRVMAAGMLATGGSSVLFSLRDVMAGAPGLSTVLRVFAYVLLAAAVVMLVRCVTGITERRFLLDAASLALGLVAVVFVILAFDVGGVPGLSSTGAILFAIADMAMASIAVSALLESGRHPVLVVTATGLLIALVADGLFAIQEHNGTYRPGTALDQLWQVAALLLVVVPWLPNQARRAPRRMRLHVLAGPLASIAVSSALAALVLVVPRVESARVLVSACVAVCVGAGLVRIVRHLHVMTTRLDVASTAAATLAHELRQPVTAARSAVAQMIPDAGGMDAVALREVDAHLEAIASRATVINPTATESRGLPVGQFLARVLRDVDPPSGAITASIPADLTADVDSAVAETILRNLIANALEHGEPPVHIHGRRRRDRVEIVIDDCGCGVALQPPALAFELGVSQHDDENRGVGLALARVLARAAGGDVLYAPTSTRRGRFVIRFKAGAS